MASIFLLCLMFAAPASEAASECMRKTTDALAQGLAREAAIQGETCWREHRHPQALLASSQAWLQAGEYARARLAARRVLSDESGAMRNGRHVASLVVQESEGHTGSIKINISPPPVPGEKIEVDARRAGSGNDNSDPIRFNLPDLEASQLRLDAGEWTLSVRRPGFVAASASVSSQVGASVVTAVTMQRRAPKRPAVIILERTPITVEFSQGEKLQDDFEAEIRRADAPQAVGFKVRAARGRTTLVLAPGPWTATVRAPGRAFPEQVLEMGRTDVVKLEVR